MTQNGEPVREPDPVQAALRMRASDADRERVADLLRDAYAEGRLSPIEHEERLSAAYQAATYGDLVPVLHDLPVPPGTLAVPESRGVDLVRTASGASGATTSGLVVRPERAGEGEATAVAVFGGFERSGAWIVRPELTAVAIFGGGEMDFTEAVLTSHETVLTITAIFGGVDITVPDGMAVRNEGFAMFGGHSVPREATPAGAPVLVIRGAAIFGGVDVHRPKGRKNKSSAD
jgi:hypothetical protein